LKLIDAALDHGTLRLQLAGPGRALVRFYSLRPPTVCDGGQPVAVQWDAAAGHGQVMISRTHTAGELTIETAA
jgi:hypothetical protein